MSILDRSESRDGFAVRVLALHTTEGNGTAQQLRDATWWEGSSHAINDESGTLLTPAQGCVPYDRASWTLRSGNRWSENLEQVGWAHWSRQDWLARPKLLDGTARWLAARSKARNIPLRKLSPAEYAAGHAGVIGHVDHTIGYQDGSHTDPGPNYPWDVVLAKARAYANGSAQEDDMPLTPDDIEKVAQRVRQVLADSSRPYGLDKLRSKLDTLLGKPAAAPVFVDPKALAAALIQQGVDLGASPEEVAEAVVDRLGSQLSSP